MEAKRRKKFQDGECGSLFQMSMDELKERLGFSNKRIRNLTGVGMGRM